MIDASLYVEINQHKKTGLFSWKWADSKRLGGSAFQTFEAAAGSVSEALAARFPGKPVDLSKLTPGEIGFFQVFGEFNVITVAFVAIECTLVASKEQLILQTRQEKPMRRYLDSLTTTCTAFDSFINFSIAMRRGWVPTIKLNTRRKRILFQILKAKGYAVHCA